MCIIDSRYISDVHYRYIKETGERAEKGKKRRLPKRCEHCNKMFSNRSNLNKHIKDIHLMLRRFSCNWCGKKFKQHVHLKMHNCKQRQHNVYIFRYIQNFYFLFCRHVKNIIPRSIRFKSVEDGLYWMKCRYFICKLSTIDHVQLTKLIKRGIGFSLRLRANLGSGHWPVSKVCFNVLVFPTLHYMCISVLTSLYFILFN